MFKGLLKKQLTKVSIKGLYIIRTTHLQEVYSLSLQPVNYFYLTGVN